MRKTKILSWYYIFAFLVIFSLGVYLYSGFTLREGAAGEKFTKDENVLVLWRDDKKYHPGKILEVNGDTYTIEYNINQKTDEVNASSIEKMPDNVVKFAATKCVDAMFLTDWTTNNNNGDPDRDEDIRKAMTFQFGCNK
jgi:hypothetical protein